MHNLDATAFELGDLLGISASAVADLGKRGIRRDARTNSSSTSTTCSGRGPRRLGQCPRSGPDNHLQHSVITSA
jgi:hypothetical protein